MTMTAMVTTTAKETKKCSYKVLASGKGGELAFQKNRRSLSLNLQG
jgi:hypothetical protein